MENIFKKGLLNGDNGPIKEHIEYQRKYIEEIVMDELKIAKKNRKTMYGDIIFQNVFLQLYNLLVEEALYKISEMDIQLLIKMINYALDTKFNNVYDIDPFWIFWESNIISKQQFIDIQSFGKIRNEVTNAHAIHNCDDEAMSNDINTLIEYISMIRKIDNKTPLKSALYFANRNTASKAE